ncbi:MAG: TIGR02147 family protein, partial [Pseudobdellovibrionaceae bacterium]
MEMMEKEIFDYADYRLYLVQWISSQPKKGRGLRAALAQAIHSPISHISQVLKGVSDLTLEQAEDANEFLGHASEHAEYFLLLVQRARAGTPRLKKRIEAQMQRIREKRLLLKNRIEIKTSISNQDQAEFYSSWLYVATHILLTIEEFQTREKVAQYFEISPSKAAEILHFLQSVGLVEQRAGRFLVGQARIHLSHDSPMVSRHHINWRLQAIRSLEKGDRSSSLHYSSVVSIARDDVLRIKSLLVKSIETAKQIIKDSKEQELHSLCLDF